jgi:hypothetical protein
MEMPGITEACQKVLMRIEAGEKQHDLLCELIEAAEASFPNTVSSILVIDENGLLRNGCSPKLPADYLAAIDGLRPNANVGTCAAAAATGNIIFTQDFIADNKWSELKHLPLALGFKGAWSMPIKNPNGIVLGTFGTYFRENRKPTQSEVNGVKELTEVAARVLMRG